MKWFEKIKPGDMLMPDPLWNGTVRRGSQLPEPVEILRSFEATSQSKWLFVVRTKNGTERMLDAAWFMKPDAAIKAQQAAEIERERTARKTAQESLENYKGECTRLQHEVDRLVNQQT